MIITQITELSKYILKEYIKSGDKVVDATLGNGNDAEFLAQIVGEQGRVYAFDIDSDAVEACKERLQSKYPQIDFILDSHENLNMHVKGTISAAIFNLGYLPGGSHETYTKADVTIKALNKALVLLKPEGVLAIASYVGHDDFQEFNAVREFMKNLNPKAYKVIFINPENQNERAPKLFICQKIKAESGLITKLMIKKSKDLPRESVKTLKLSSDCGIVDDIHAGRTLRQISLLSQSTKSSLQDYKMGLCVNRFSENIRFDNLEIMSLKVSQQLKIADAVLEITQIGKECFEDCLIRKENKRCPLYAQALFARVIVGGDICLGDEIEPLPLI